MSAKNTFSLRLTDPKMIASLGQCKSGETKELTFKVKLTKVRDAIEPDYDSMPVEVKSALGKDKKPPEKKTHELDGEVLSVGYEEKEPKKAIKKPKKMSPAMEAAMEY